MFHSGAIRESSAVKMSFENLIADEFPIVSSFVGDFGGASPIAEPLR